MISFQEESGGTEVGKLGGFKPLPQCGQFLRALVLSASKNRAALGQIVQRRDFCYVITQPNVVELKYIKERDFAMQIECKNSVLI